MRAYIVNIEENYFAIGNECPNCRGPLNEWTFEEYDVESPWHGSKFDVRTGNPTKLTDNQFHYEVKMEGNDISLEKPLITKKSKYWE